MELKTVFISFNQAYLEVIQGIISKQNLKGYTYWETVRGVGSNTGEPHMGSHAWPTLNGAIMLICPSEKVDPLLAALKKLDETTPAQGLRAFVWAVEKII